MGACFPFYPCVFTASLSMGFEEWLFGGFVYEEPPDIKRRPVYFVSLLTLLFTVSFFPTA